MLPYQLRSGAERTWQGLKEDTGVSSRYHDEQIGRGRSIGKPKQSGNTGRMLREEAHKKSLSAKMQTGSLKRRIETDYSPYFISAWRLYPSYLHLALASVIANNFSASSGAAFIKELKRTSPIRNSRNLV